MLHGARYVLAYLLGTIYHRVVFEIICFKVLVLQRVLELTIELQIKIKTFFHSFASIVISQVPTQAPLSLVSAASQLPQDF